jgi:hypothetical protein
VRLLGYLDSDWAGGVVDGKSTFGGCFSLGSTIVSWYNKKQTFMALSSMKVEYVAANLAICEAIWLHKLLAGLFGEELEPTMIHCYNHRCIKISENPVFRDR